MYYTVPIAAEKALELMGVEPLFARYSDAREINGFSTATRARRGRSVWRTGPR